MTLEVLAMRGYPASSKTTLAELWVASEPESRARLSRDNLRAGLFAIEGVGSQPQENLISKVIKSQAETLLEAGVSVVIDNTNLRIRDLKEWQALAHKFGALFEVRNVPTDVETCILRDAERKRAGGRGVGEKVIRNFATRFPISQWQDIPPVAIPVPGRQYYGTPGRPKAVGVDLDGTLANFTNVRGPFETSKYHLDETHPEIVRLTKALELAGYKIIILSGRSEDFKEVCLTWLKDECDLVPEKIVMRHSGDIRNDAVVKPELFWNEIADDYDLDFVVDDRTRVTEALRHIGLRVLQVQGENY